MTSEPDPVDSPVPYRIWFGVGIVSVFLSLIFSANHEELTKLSWTIIAPGFIMAQTWKCRHDGMFWAGLVAIISVHFFIMEAAYPHLPDHNVYIYVLLISFIETMTIGVPYQTWLEIRQSRQDKSR